MALFTDSNQTLEDVLGQKASDATSAIEDSYAKSRRKLVGQEAHAGRLSSGVSNYDFGDLASSEAGDIGGVQSGLADALGQIPSSDIVDQKEEERNRILAEYIASLNKPSALQQTFGALGSGAKVFGSVAGSMF
jgi:hypothetical protein